MDIRKVTCRIVTTGKERYTCRSTSCTFPDTCQFLTLRLLLQTACVLETPILLSEFQTSTLLNNHHSDINVRDLLIVDPSILHDAYQGSARGWCIHQTFTLPDPPAIPSVLLFIMSWCFKMCMILSSLFVCIELFFLFL